MELRAEHLTCSRGGREVFRNVSFKVPAREALIVTGRNGAGKSSLLRMIAGLLRATAGRLVLDEGAPDQGLEFFVGDLVTVHRGSVPSRMCRTADDSPAAR